MKNRGRTGEAPEEPGKNRGRTGEAPEEPGKSRGALGRGFFFFSKYLLEKHDFPFFEKKITKTNNQCNFTKINGSHARILKRTCLEIANRLSTGSRSWAYTFLYTLMYSYTFLYIPIHSYTFLYTPMYSYTFLYIPIHSYIYIPIHSYTFRYIPTNSYTFLYSYCFVAVCCCSVFPRALIIDACC